MFLKKIEQYKKMPIAYVDESGFAHSMPRTHGYSRMGKRCYGSCDWNARGRKNVIAALYESSIIGCGIIEDNIDTNVFNTWIEKILIPDLPDKSVIVMDIFIKISDKIYGCMILKMAHIGKDMEE